MQSVQSKNSCQSMVLHSQTRPPRGPRGTYLSLSLKVLDVELSELLLLLLRPKKLAGMSRVSSSEPQGERLSLVALESGGVGGNC